MEVKQKITEEELEDLLKAGDVEFFLQALYQDYQEQIVRLIDRASLGLLDTDELGEVFQDTIIEIWKKLEDGKFNSHRPMRLVNQIAKCNAKDALGKKLRLRKIGTKESDLTDILIDDLKDTNLAYELRLANEDELQRLRAELPEILLSLSESQRIVFLAFQNSIEDIRANDKYRPVVEAVEKATGKRLSVSAVRSRLNEAFRKIRDEACRRKFNFMEEREI